MAHNNEHPPSHTPYDDPLDPAITLQESLEDLEPHGSDVKDYNGWMGLLDESLTSLSGSPPPQREEQDITCSNPSVATPKAAQPDVDAVQSHSSRITPSHSPPPTSNGAIPALAEVDILSSRRRQFDTGPHTGRLPIPSFHSISPETHNVIFPTSYSTAPASSSSIELSNSHALIHLCLRRNSWLVIGSPSSLTYAPPVSASGMVAPEYTPPLPTRGSKRSHEAAFPQETGSMPQPKFQRGNYPPPTKLLTEEVNCKIPNCQGRFKCDKGGAQMHIRASHAALAAVADSSKPDWGKRVVCPWETVDEQGTAIPCLGEVQIGNLGRHIISVHFAHKPAFLCPKASCGQPFTRSDPAIRHIRLVCYKHSEAEAVLQGLENLPVPTNHPGDRSPSRSRSRKKPKSENVPPQAESPGERK
ncbi:hypothetical protein A0H81_01821 [Grifola frondosa]|uniref:C2H2-type domain-containing protein n=1 Tax=Grifola frondosa TaxID=5627 RepID=A0A1C7MLW3_GRIFR|nr:hypothetical protein A0H81_01821 [Grifola frondosa]